MFAKRAAIAALEGVAAADGDFAAGRRFLAGIDPLVRGRAARLMRAAHVDALSTTRVRGPRADAHAARLAYLELSGRPVAPELADDVESVRAAFDEARRGRRPFARWLWPFTLGAVALIAGGGLALARLSGAMTAWSSAATGRGARSPATRPPPPPGGAYANGGSPREDEVVQHAFAVDLPDFLIALDRAASAATDVEVAALRADADAAELRATSPDVRARLGDEAARCLGELLAAVRRASSAGAAGHEPDASALLEATGALDDSLAARDLAYFVDGDVIVEGQTGRRHVIIYAFDVLRVSVFESDERVLALELRRIDRLNWSHALLGFTRPQLRAALVLLDPVDRQLVSTILPGLAPNGRVPLFDPTDPSVPRELVQAVEARAGEVVREGYADAADPTASGRLGEALGRRAALFEVLQERLAVRGVNLRMPTGLHVEGDYHHDLGEVVAEPDLAILDDIEKTLAEPAIEAAFVAARERLVASIARHEVQHRLDFVRREPLPMPAQLERWVGPLEGDGKERPAAARARSEMSAYLAQLARDEGTTRADATLVLRFLLDDKMQGIPECFAAIAILEGLCDELAIPITEPLVERASIVRERTARLSLAILDKPADAIRAAAKRVWEKSFHAELPPLRRLPSP